MKQGMMENSLPASMINGTGSMMPQFIQTNGGYTAGTSLLNLHKARDSNMLPDITNSQIFNQQATAKQIDFESKAQQRLKEVLDTSRDEDEEECEYDDEDLVSSDP